MIKDDHIFWAQKGYLSISLPPPFWHTNCNKIKSASVMAFFPQPQPILEAFHSRLKRFNLTIGFLLKLNRALQVAGLVSNRCEQNRYSNITLLEPSSSAVLVGLLPCLHGHTPFLLVSHIPIFLCTVCHGPPTSLAVPSAPSSRHSSNFLSLNRPTELSH